MKLFAGVVSMVLVALLSAITTFDSAAEIDLKVLNRTSASSTEPAPKIQKAAGAYDPAWATQLRSMVVPDPSYPPGQTYPQGEAVIWVPTDAARSHYMMQTNFHPSVLAAQGISLATPADVKGDLTKYGYRFSTKPPAYVPDIDYSAYGETPVYPFVGQMVPGTNLQHTDPVVPPVWLVDITNVGGKDVVVPALTTIDFTKFRSINWPRERYVIAIQKANSGHSHPIGI